MKQYIVAAGLSILLAPLSVATAAESPCPYTWNTNLHVGTISSDVLQLQKFLNSDPATTIASTGPGSPGSETSKFGVLTTRAVIKFQEKYAAEVLAPADLSHGTGVVGTLTRAKLNTLCKGSVLGASTTTVSTPVVHDALTIAPSEQPSSSLAPANASDVPFTKFTLTAGDKDVEVRSITVERTGPGTDGAFYSVGFADKDGEYIGNDRGLDSNHRVVLGEPFTIPAHETQSFTIVGNMNSDMTNYAGQIPSFQIIAIDASSPIEGTLPLRGSYQVVNDTLTIGSARTSLGQYDPGVSTNRYINDSHIRFAGIRVAADSREDLTLYSITWRQNGTASVNDIADLATVINGVRYPVEIDGHSYTSSFGEGIALPKGQTIDAYLEGNITMTGAQRTVKFDIDSSGDVFLTGNIYGYTVPVYAEGNTATEGNSVFITSDGTTDGDEGTPFFSASTVTINSGTAVTIQNAN